MEVAAHYIDEIEALAGAFADDERNLTLYFPDFDTPPREDSLNRVFGPPVGVTDLEWPLYPRLGELLAAANMLDRWDGDLRMEHVFTVDLRGIRLLGAPPGARAMQLFLSNASYHGAHHKGNGDAAVLFLTEEEVARGLYRGSLPDRSLQRWSRRFSLRRIDVPGDIFDPQPDGTTPLARLYDAVWQAPARLGGCPIWVRDPDRPCGRAPLTDTRPVARRPVGLAARDTFVMQFERRFADVNLGRDGVMYVEGCGAYYQSYDL